MLRVDRCCLGRWGPRDFLRGRMKRGGAIHTRPTHGSRGRYTRLSTLYGLREGRRHAGNRLGGGLGIKLGGGLFGLRLPRQHALARMDKAAYELTVYGHPNITNPYRDQLQQHPDLHAVMRNAELRVHLLLLMPRTPRRLTESEKEIPQSWEHLLEHVGGIIERESSLLGGSERCVITTHCATMSASITCQHSTINELRSSGISLFKDHMRGSKLRSSLQKNSLQKGKYERKRIPLLGVGLSKPTFSQTNKNILLSSSSSSSSSFFDIYNQISPRILSHDAESNNNNENNNENPMNTMVQTMSTKMMNNNNCSSSIINTVNQKGIQELLHELRQSGPNALNLCLRLDEILPSNNIDNEKEEKDEVKESPRKLLKEEIDPDEVGVWKRPASSVNSLMRWQYFNWDPRAHSSDILPHHRRLQPVHIFIDASRVRGNKNDFVNNKNSHNRHKLVGRSLMPLQLSEKLHEMNFSRVNHKGIAETLAALRNWSVEHQWRALEEMQTTAKEASEQ